MSQICARNLCTGCGACANVCPSNCILMQPDREGFLYPKIDADACRECGLCRKVCPINAKKPNSSLKKAYAAYLADWEIRRNSSSGGVFTAIAQYVIKQGGVVFGACLEENLKVVHSYADTTDGLSAFRGSKYVQSEIGDTYRQAEDFLKQGRLVLFSGTPCQIGGLKSYLGKPYENLICQDIICHGVPSPLAWEKYLAELAQIYGSSPVGASFRDKTRGWSNFSMGIWFGNQEKHLESMKQDNYMKAFLGNYCLRNSCYQCSFKQEAREADITLADFWGIDHVAPVMNDDRGTSLVLIHSQRGKGLFEEVCDILDYSSVDWTASIGLNPAMCDSVTRPKKRDAFMKLLHSKEFSYAVRHCCKPSGIAVLKSIAETIRYLPNKTMLHVLGPEKYEALKAVFRRV